MGYSSMVLGKGFDQPYRSVNEIVEHLIQFPFQTESQIQEDVFGYFRNETWESRGLAKGLYRRILWKRKSDSRSLYRYYVPTSLKNTLT